jgi:acyl-CoA dehydrogenase
MYQKLLNRAKKLIPRISQTERIALNSGTKSVEELFFKGHFPKKYLKDNFPYPSTSSNTFINQDIEKFCNSINDYEIFQKKEIPSSVYDEIKKNKLFGMIIPKKYGGLELNHHLQSQVVQKISTASNPVGVVVMVPNSLGPAELLLKYGTDQEKDKYLEKLANGEYIPCFGLTGQHSGSDAASMLDTGVVFEKDNKKYIRLNVSKRYITLAPISNLVGISFKLSDPEKLLKEGKEGITLALLEPSIMDFEIGSRHNPMDVPFPNGTIRSKNLIIPIESIIGGEKNSGIGWNMLMDCLAVGRSISLPACAVGNAKLTMNYVGAYSIYRKQFNTMLANMEGVQMKLANIGSETIKITAMQYLTNSILDSGFKPSVIGAIMKYETTERARIVVNDGMDIVAGSGICKGPNNILGNIYQSLPIGVTVEGSNTLTKSLIIFGQGLMKSHPYLYNLVQSIENNNVIEFKKNLHGIINNSISNILNSFYYKFYGNTMFLLKNQDILEEKFITNFAITSNIILLMGTKFKSNEMTSGRMAEIMGSLYIIRALDWFNENNKNSLHDLVKYAKYQEYEKIQRNLNDISLNYPNILLRQLLKCINKETLLNKQFKITDKMIKNASDSITKNIHVRTILSENIFMNDKLKVMNDNLQEVLLNEKNKTPANYRLNIIIDEITKVDEFSKL